MTVYIDDLIYKENSMSKLTTHSVRRIVASKGKTKLVVLTCYDALTAKIFEACGVDMILVGDSMGTVVMGYPYTLPVTYEDIFRCTVAVRNGAPDSFVISDMPFLTYGVSVEESVRNAGRFLKEAGANAVKIEGGKEFAPTVKAMVAVGIPVMGHIGLKPQSVHKDGYRIAGKTAEETAALIEDAKALEAAGVFSMVVEGTTEEAAKEITAAVKVPTIGIGAGRFTDGQVLVTPDMLGMDADTDLKHNKRYTELHKTIADAVNRYSDDVRGGKFPEEGNVTHRA